MPDVEELARWLPGAAPGGRGQGRARVSARLYELVRRAGAGGWLAGPGVADVALVAGAVHGDLGELGELGAGLTGQAGAGFGGPLRVLTGGAGAADSGFAGGLAPGMADLVLVASRMRGEQGLAPDAGLRPGELTDSAWRWAGETTGRRTGMPGPGVLGAAAGGVRQWAAGLLGVAAERWRRRRPTRSPGGCRVPPGGGARPGRRAGAGAGAGQLTSGEAGRRAPGGGGRQRRGDRGVRAAAALGGGAARAWPRRAAAPRWWRR